MSLVAIKNAVSKLVSKNDEAPLLSNNNNHNNSYGSSTDVESGKNTHEDQLDYPQPSNGLGFFGKVDPRVMSDLIIGLSDGLTVPFALTAGLSSLGDARLVITGGFAELISGAISMGLGGYLGAKSESDYYKSEVSQEKKKFYSNTQLINHEIEDILLEMNPNFSEDTVISFVKDMQRDPGLMVDFIIKYGKGLDEPDDNRQWISAVTIGGGYFAGGFVPLVPYFFVDKVITGLLVSIVLMTITLFWFGYFKSQVSMADSTLQRKVLEGLQMVAVGGVAAGAAWFFVKIIE
ncbi:protein CCC1 [Kluyveromyces marxianus]|uniref:Protein CCC1 n=1 Tax=Kluyveromyces marxianus TaxID=4911 RepID=A0ABX6ET95_KLUMA|nr:protein CCC1 [Kluyveromyces marxianus]